MSIRDDDEGALVPASQRGEGRHHVPPSSAHEMVLAPSHAAPADNDDRVGQAIGRFKITGVLGRGGMGVVYSALDRTLKRQVALKLLSASAVESASQRRGLLEEARAAASVVHPNVAAIFDVGEIGDVVFIAMERVDGRSLRGVMVAAAAALPELRAIEIARDIARGLAAAHVNGLSHRDIKPENVMLSARGAIKLVDFGLARAHGASAFESTGVTTQEGRVLGTPSYMSPEQARGLPADARSDVFALGVVLFEMLACVRPFTGATVVEVLVGILRDAPPPLTFLREGPAGPLARIILRCLEKDASRRYADAGDLLAALEATLPAATRARPSPSRRRRWRWLAWLWVAGPAIAGAIIATTPPPAERPEEMHPAPVSSTATVVMTAISAPEPSRWTPSNAQYPHIAPFRIPMQDSVTALALSQTSLALTSSGAMISWGSDLASAPTWFMLDPAPRAKAVASGGSVLMAVDSESRVWVWTDKALRRVRLDRASTIRSIAVNFYGALLLHENGAVSMLEFADRTDAGVRGSTSKRNADWIAGATIDALPGLDHAIAIAAEQDLWLALRENGTVWSMTSRGLSDPLALPWGWRQEQGVVGAVAIASGVYHSLALDREGAVWGWGNSMYYQVDPASERDQAVRIPGLPKIKAIAAGANNSLALDDTGRVWEWGTAYEGQDVHQKNAVAAREAHLPRLVDGLPSVRLIATSGSTSVAVAAADGGLWAWGVTADHHYWFPDGK